LTFFKLFFWKLTHDHSRFKTTGPTGPTGAKGNTGLTGHVGLKGAFNWQSVFMRT